MPSIAGPSQTPDGGGSLGHAMRRRLGIRCSQARSRLLRCRRAPSAPLLEPSDVSDALMTIKEGVLSDVTNRAFEASAIHVLRMESKRLPNIGPHHKKMGAEEYGLVRPTANRQPSTFSVVSSGCFSLGEWYLREPTALCLTLLGLAIDLHTISGAHISSLLSTLSFHIDRSLL